MIATKIGHVFQNDFIMFNHGTLGLTYGKALKFFKKVSFEINAHVPSIFI